MGNPAILPRPAGEPVAPPRLQVLWMVYHLRRDGAKLTREDVLRTARRGALEIRQEGQELVARLMAPGGYEVLDILRAVRLVRHDAEGMLLHGITIHTKGASTKDVPQAWWCLVSSAQPSGGAPAEAVS